MTENEEKRLESIREKIAQMKNQARTIRARDRAKRQKERTRRLIQNGALAEKYLCCEDIQPKEFERLLKQIADVQEVKIILQVEQTK
jgi:hypothetical protein